MRDGFGVPAKIESLRGELERALSPKRRAHSEGAARKAKEFAIRLGLDADKAVFAALAHDLCKELETAEQIRLARRFPCTLPDCVYENPKLPHGPAAAVRLTEDFGVDDADVLEAVAYHTIGRAGMGDLALAVYCADKMEPGRIGVGPAALEACARDGIVEMSLAVVADLIAYYLRERRRVAPETVFLYNDLLARSQPS